jgi:hypothetical protein
MTVGRKTIASMTGWADSGDAIDVITKTIELLAEGKAVRLTSHQGWCEFQPLGVDEDGSKIPASWDVVYNPDGTVFSRKIKNGG